MKPGDLVTQLCWEDDGVGLITKIWHGGMGTSKEHKYATVQWPNGTVDMYYTQLKVVGNAAR